MRQLRSKAYRKLMAMYSTSFGFRQPYQVLGALVPTRPPKKLKLNTFLLLTDPLLPLLSLVSGL